MRLTFFIYQIRRIVKMIFTVLPIAINHECAPVCVHKYTTLWLAYKIFQKEKTK